MDGGTIAFGIYLLAGVGLTLWTVIWALLKMTVRGCIYIAGVATAIGLGITQLGADAMWTAVAGTILLWPVVYFFGVLLPIGILAKLGPDPRGGNQHIPAPETSVGGDGEVMETPYDENRPQAQCSFGCVYHEGSWWVSDENCPSHGRMRR